MILIRTELAVLALAQAPAPQALVGMLVIAPLIALSLTVHEFWHAYSAELMGDHTARVLGRCTLNPLAHLDPLGTFMLLVGPVGWAKPVPINPTNFANPSRGMFISTAAGPASNLALALLFGLILRILVAAGLVPDVPAELNDAVQPSGLLWTYAALGMALTMNIFLCLFNLIPLFPLDGHHLLRESLRGEAKRRFAETQHYGIFILMALILAPRLFGYSSLIRTIIGPPGEKLMLLFAGAHGLAYAELSRFLLRDYFAW